MIEIICKNCQKSILASPSRKNRKKYCSKQCQYADRVNCKASEETRKKMSESSKKSINSGRFKKGSIPFSKLHPELSPRGEQHWKWSGGKTKTVTGYIWEYAPDHPKANHGYVYQHRLVIERILKRKLKSSECVHHISEKTDNHPSKLIVFSSNSAHMRFHKSEKNVYPDEIIFDGRSYV